MLDSQNTQGADGHEIKKIPVADIDIVRAHLRMLEGEGNDGKIENARLLTKLISDEHRGVLVINNEVIDSFPQLEQGLEFLKEMEVTSMDFLTGALALWKRVQIAWQIKQGSAANKIRKDVLPGAM